MRLSCNGCRVLRKGCTDACTIRPCLQWIKTPDAQANATVFLAKFYGRAGLLNLLAASPTPDQRPAVFRSLLYEACGRVVNPVYGAVGLLWSGAWSMCQAAVEAVLKGDPIVQLDAQDQAAQAPPHYDIRHVKKHPAPLAAPAAAEPAPLPPHPHQKAEPAAGRTTRCKRGTSPSSSSSSSSSPSKKKKVAALSTEVVDDDHTPPVPDVVDEKPDHDHDDQHQHPVVSTSQWPHHTSSDDHNNTDAEAGSHVTTVAAEGEEEDDDAHEQHPQHHLGLGLDLTLGFGSLSSSSSSANIATQAAAADDGDQDQDQDQPGVVLGFRFL